MVSRTRLQRELALARKEVEPDVRFELKQDNIFKWRCMLRGPEDSPYEGCWFELDIKMPENYPLYPPNVRFLTKIFHSNIHWETGEVCVDFLKTNWVATWTLHSLTRAILVLLASPNADSPLNCDAGNLVRYGDKRGFATIAKMYAEEYGYLEK